MGGNATAITRRDFVPYVTPLLVFLVVTYLTPVLPFPVGVSYLIKTVLTGVALYYYRDAYISEIKPVFSWTAILAGVLVFFIWILPDSLYPHIGSSEFNPYSQASGTGVYLLMAIRMAGAVLVVPVMEEIFWRSFALRFVIQSDFKSLPLGTFSLWSFILVSVAFGFEHYRWLVGIAAGMVYAWLLYRSKNLFEPILSHAVTNLLLGIYVIHTQSWGFW